MHIRLLLLLIFSLSFSNIKGQTSPLDSIRVLLDGASESSKIDLWLTIAKENYTNAPDSVLKYATLALESSKAANDLHLVARSLQSLGHGKTLIRAYTEADSLLNSALSISINLNDSVLLSKSYNLLGVNCFYEQNLETALNFYLKSLEIDELTSNMDEIHKSYGNIGTILSMLKRYEKSIAYLRQALQILGNNNQGQSAMQIYFNLMYAYDFHTGAKDKLIYLDSTIYFAEKGLSVSESLNHQMAIAKFSSVLAATYNKRDRFEDAVAMSELAITKSKMLGDSITMEESQINKGYAYLGLKDFVNARTIVNHLLMHSAYKQNDALRLSYQTEKAAGNFQTALLRYERLKTNTDSLRLQQDNEKIIAIEQKFDTQKKEEQIRVLTTAAQIQELEFRQQSLIYLLIIGIVLILALVILFIYQINKSKARQATIDFEQKLLRNQLNPHFIFNALAAIQNFMMNNDAVKAGLYLSKFSKIMRQILEHSREDFISIAEEMDMLENYLLLQQARFQEKFEYTIEIGEEIDSETIMIPPMFAQPFLENAIEHGISDMKGAGKISILMTQQKDTIHIEITDNGRGVEKTPNSSGHKSLATVITKERISLFSRSVREKIAFTSQNISNDRGVVKGTKVILIIPFKMKY